MQKPITNLKGNNVHRLFDTANRTSYFCDSRQPAFIL